MQRAQRVREVGAQGIGGGALRVKSSQGVSAITPAAGGLGGKKSPTVLLIGRRETRGPLGVATNEVNEVGAGNEKNHQVRMSRESSATGKSYLTKGT